MKALITGGAGFIGSNLARRLVRDGVETHVVDNLLTGSKENIIDLMNKSNFKFHISNLREFDGFASGYDVVFHQASSSTADLHVNDPVEACDNTVTEFVYLLEQARRYNFKVVFASTCSAYGGIDGLQKEEYKVRAKNLYSAAKLSMERYMEAFYEKYRLPVCCLRYFSVYGPGEKAKGKYANAITQFIWKMMNNESPVLFGDGTQKRDFVYVTDVVEANVLAYKKLIPATVFNIGTGNSYTFNEVVKMINNLMNKNIKPKYVENPYSNYIYNTHADITRAKETLGYNPKVQIKEGIQKVVEWYRTHGF